MSAVNIKYLEFSICLLYPLLDQKTEKRIGSEKIYVSLFLFDSVLHKILASLWRFRAAELLPLYRFFPSVVHDLQIHTLVFFYTLSNRKLFTSQLLFVHVIREERRIFWVLYPNHFAVVVVFALDARSMVCNFVLNSAFVGVSYMLRRANARKIWDYACDDDDDAAYLLVHIHAP